MTRKDFIALAASIRNIADLNTRKAMAKNQAVLCASANPRFDKARFFAACGV